MNKLMDRISVSPHVCHGQPCIKNTRIMVYLVLELLEAGLTPDEIIRDCYPQLGREDIDACLHYAASLIRDTEYVPFTPCNGFMKPGEERLCGNCEAQFAITKGIEDTCVWCELGKGFQCSRHLR